MLGIRLPPGVPKLANWLGLDAVPQFLTGLFPAIFGGEMEHVKTATGYSIARDQAKGYTVTNSLTVAPK